ncbi:YrhK family protein [Paenibacillus kandeliae]|uniref:YrhK family protein n=1 Tax=Paenibacillus kandeliae TaxID=3231269 RepID=UPI00345A6C3B
MNNQQDKAQSPQPLKRNRIRIRRPDSYKLTVEFKDRRLVTQNCYELISLLNDIITTVCFLIGSYFFFTSDTKTGTIMFIIGNANTLFRAILAMIRKFHIEWITQEEDDGKKTSEMKVTEEKGC